MICFVIWPLLYHHHKLSKQVIKGMYFQVITTYQLRTLPKDAKTSVENDCKVHATADSHIVELTN